MIFCDLGLESEDAVATGLLGEGVHQADDFDRGHALVEHEPLDVAEGTCFILSMGMAMNVTLTEPKIDHQDAFAREEHHEVAVRDLKEHDRQATEADDGADQAGLVHVWSLCATRGGNGPSIHARRLRQLCRMEHGAGVPRPPPSTRRGAGRNGQSAQTATPEQAARPAVRSRTSRLEAGGGLLGALRAATFPCPPHNHSTTAQHHPDRQPTHRKTQHSAGEPAQVIHAALPSPGDRRAKAVRQLAVRARPRGG